MNESRTHQVYWHRELPPLNAELMGEYEVEATSGRVSGAPNRGTDLWDRAYGELMANTETRLQQEIARLGGDGAHVLHESVHSRRDDAVGEAWLHGVFTYALYRRCASTEQASPQVPRDQHEAQRSRGPAGASTTIPVGSAADSGDRLVHSGLKPASIVVTA